MDGNDRGGAEGAPTTSAHAAYRPRRARANTAKTQPAQRAERVRKGTAEIGSLRDDIDELAGRIVRASDCRTVLVWVDDQYRVHGVAPSSAQVPAHCIVGTYGCGVAVADIAEDLRHERQQRERAWYID